jgi:hypothetical protein
VVPPLIEELFNEIDRTLDKAIEEFRRLAEVRIPNTKKQVGCWDILDIDDSSEGDLDSLSTDGDLSLNSSFTDDDDLSDFDFELDEGDL